MKLNATLDEQASKRFQEIKEHFGVKSNPSVIGILISQEHGRIERSKRHKVFLPNEIYDKAEKAAKTLNLTLDEYVDSVTELLLKQTPLEKVPEGLKHGKK